MKALDFLKEESPDCVLLSLYVQPGASKTQWSGLHGESLKLRIQAPPVEGQANKALIQFLAKEFGVSKSSISLVKGDTSRFKTFKIQGLNLQKALDTLQPYISDLV